MTSHLVPKSDGSIGSEKNWHAQRQSIGVSSIYCGSAQFVAVAELSPSVSDLRWAPMPGHSGPVRETSSPRGAQPRIDPSGASDR